MRISTVVARVLPVFVAAVLISSGSAAAQGPALGPPGAINGGYGAPGAMQPSMGVRRSPGMRFSRGQGPAQNSTAAGRQFGNSRANVLGSQGRVQGIIDQAGVRSSQRIIQNSKQIQRPLSNFTF